MSYNVTDWRTKRIENLRIPVVAFSTLGRVDWRPDRLKAVDGRDVFGWTDTVYLSGRVEGDQFIVEEIEAYDECSGMALYEVIEPALAQSTGELEVVRIWEGGDSIDRLTVLNGVVKTEDVEL